MSIASSFFLKCTTQVLKVEVEVLCYVYIKETSQKLEYHCLYNFTYLTYVTNLAKLSLMVNHVMEQPRSIILTKPKGSSIISITTASRLTSSGLSRNQLPGIPPSRPHTSIPYVKTKVFRAPSNTELFVNKNRSSICPPPRP